MLGDRKLSRLVISGAALTALTFSVAACGSSGDDSGGGSEKKEIKIGYIAWDEDVAVTNLWKKVLEKKGYTVDMTQLDAAPLFAGMSKGDIDVFFDGWLPNTHKKYWEKYGDKLEDVGTWYDTATLGIAVPDYVKAKSLSDLKANAGKFDNKIIGIEPGAGEMGVVKDDVMPAYGLDKGMKLVSSSTPAMLAQLKKSIAQKKPIAVTLWKPHWAYSKFPIRDLKDPKGAWGKAEKLHTISSKDFKKDSPQAYKWFKNFHMEDKQLSKLEADIQDAGKGKEAAGVQKWMDANKDFVKKMTK